MSLNELGDNPAIAESAAIVSVEAEAKPEIDAVAEPAPAKPESAPEDKIQKRFDKLTRDKYDALRERDRLLYELEQLKANAQKTAVAQQPLTLESSGYDEGKYQAAVLEYAKAAAKEEAARLINEREEYQQKQGKNQEFETRQAEFIKSKPDYVEKVMENDGLMITESMANIIRYSELGPQIAYYLAENDEITAKISKLPPLVQAREIGRIEAKLEAVKAVSIPQVSKAPPPPAKLDAAEAEVEKSPSDMTQDQFNKWRRKYLKR